SLASKGRLGTDQIGLSGNVISKHLRLRQAAPLRDLVLRQTIVLQNGIAPIVLFGKRKLRGRHEFVHTAQMLRKILRVQRRKFVREPVPKRSPIRPGPGESADLDPPLAEGKEEAILPGSLATERADEVSAKRIALA